MTNVNFVFVVIVVMNFNVVPTLLRFLGFYRLLVIVWA